MSIETQTCPCVVVRCDRCQEALALADEGSYAHYEDEQHGREAAKDADWFLGAGVMLCLSCCEDAAFYEVDCPRCGAEKEESCPTEAGLFCEERIEALAAKVKEALDA